VLMINFIKDIHQQMSASVTDRTMRNIVIPVVCSFALCYRHTQIQRNTVIPVVCSFALCYRHKYRRYSNVCRLRWFEYV